MDYFDDYDYEKEEGKEPIRILDKNFKRQMKEHLSRNKYKYLITGTLILLVMGFILGRKSKKSCYYSSITAPTSTPSFDTSTLRELDRCFKGWPFPKYLSGTEISSIPVVSKWKEPLKAINIFNLEDLVKYVRCTGNIRRLLEEPGIGESTIKAISNFIRNNTSDCFYSLYF